jgi:hypothetical protein
VDAELAELHGRAATLAPAEHTYPCPMSERAELEQDALDEAAFEAAYEAEQDRLWNCMQEDDT